MTPPNFTRKKVESLTLGEKLRKLRGDFRMSLSEISKGTRIQVKYLEYLENGQYGKLPADVYVRGFLRSYARYLNIDEQALVKLYERERNIQENLGHDVSRHASEKKYADIPSLVITPRSVVLVLIFFLVGGAFLYLFQEFRAFAGEPRLVILDPAQDAVIEASEITVKGKTDKGARVSINNQPVFVGGDGDFSDTLILQPGLNTITVVSVNRFDKQKSETFSIEARYEPSVATSPGGGADKTETFRMEVTSRDAAVSVSIESDGEIVFNGVLRSGETQVVAGKERVVIITENPERIFFRLNGAEETLLGKKELSGKKIVFTAAGRQE